MSDDTIDFRSDRTDFLEQSAIRGMTRECERVDGLNLGQGVCPLPSPPQLLEATAQAITDDLSTYSRWEGVEPLRDALADKLARHNGLDIDPDRELVTTVGSAGAFTCTLQGLFNEGDEIIVFEPYYGYHVNAIRVCDCSAKVVTLEPPNWELDRSMLEEAIGENTRGIVVNTPANPSGKVFSRPEMEAIADVCKSHDLLAITDEIYEYMVYGDAEHISLATLDGMFERTVTISGFSKTFAITGWRLGYAAAPEHLAEPIGLVNDLFYICAPTPLQHGLARGLEVLDDDYYAGIREKYRRNRDLFCEALNDGGFTPHVPDGSYYILADVSSLGCENSAEAAMTLLEERGVAAIPGEAFFTSDAGRHLLRFCVAQPRKVLEEAAKRISVPQRGREGR